MPVPALHLLASTTLSGVLQCDIRPRTADGRSSKSRDGTGRCLQVGRGISCDSVSLLQRLGVKWRMTLCGALDHRMPAPKAVGKRLLLFTWHHLEASLAVCVLGGRRRCGPGATCCAPRWFPEHRRQTPARCLRRSRSLYWACWPGDRSLRRATPAQTLGNTLVKTL